MSWNILDSDGVAGSSIVIEGVNYTGNGPYPDASGANYSTPISALPAGTYNYTITAVDNAGNSSQLPGSFTLTGGSTTGTDPVISRVAVSQAMGFMSWNILDSDGVAGSSIVIEGVNYTGNGPYPDASGVNYSTPISALSAGTYTYTITAVDNAGNSSQLPGSFTLTGSSSLVARKAVYSGLGRSLKSGLDTSAKLDWLYDIDAFEVGSDKEEGSSSSAVDAVMATY